jgi:hypothetical protein
MNANAVKITSMYAIVVKVIHKTDASFSDKERHWRAIRNDGRKKRKSTKLTETHGKGQEDLFAKLLGVI